MSDSDRIEKISEITETVLDECNYRLYEIRMNEVSRVLTVYIDKKDGSVTVGDCRRVSAELSRRLDESDAVIGPYTLEVSSPGVDRPLKRPEHYEWAIGKVVELTVGKNIIQGYLRSTVNDGVVVATDSGEYSFKYKDIVKAKVVEELHYDKR